MNTYVDAEAGSPGRRSFPAYGPIDAALGFVVFYVFVTRATPTLVAVGTRVLPGVSPGTVSTWLAVVLWFIFLVTTAGQVRRQLAALGIGTHEKVSRHRGGGPPSASQGLVYLLVVLVGGAVAAWTFDGAVDAGISLIRIVSTLDVGAFAVAELVVMVVFFVSFGAATHSLDRLLIGGLRAVFSPVG